MKEITVKLPCNINDKIYIIAKHDNTCHKCVHGEKMHYNYLECYFEKQIYKKAFLEPPYKCPETEYEYEIRERICEVFEIASDNQENIVVIGPCEYGPDGTADTITGCDNKVYYTYEDALKGIEEIKNSLA